MDIERPILSVSKLSQLIRLDLESEFSNIWVCGEVSNLTLSSLGHAYFTLKDENSQIRVVIFKTRLRYLKIRPENGREIILHGGVSVYEKRGEYQLIGDYLEPKGIGSLQLLYEELKKRLQEEGLFDAAHKKPLPCLAKTIGLITSLGGAVLHDILNIGLRRNPDIHIIINPVQVQGDVAVPQIVKAIEDLNAIPEIEVIILARGGGSLEDLCCFNHEAVARAIYASAKPIVSAIGHETDFTIADFVADKRAPTPSAAAELVVADRQQLLQYLVHTQKRLELVFRHNLNQNKQRLAKISHSRCFVHPAQVILSQYQQQLNGIKLHLLAAHTARINQSKLLLAECEQRIIQQHPKHKLATHKIHLQHLHNKIIAGIEIVLQQKKNKMLHLSASMDALSPLKVLNRGYSICLKQPEGELVKAANQVSKNDSLAIILSQGHIICTVNDSKEDNYYGRKT
ncbi:MAG: exodeoxyribonuclease VII large subunit [Candidatus Schekmanbacteria bacterium]|nr:exodeoxyribonuclease VII large subunit [Candidatus Schekmanbacteria bacterium]